MGTHSPKVDAYIEKAQPFAQPVLEHIRSLMHEACPDVEEAIKWSMPFFVYKGAILANMAAFKQHCAFGFWGQEMTAVLRKAKVANGDAMGSLGRLSSVKDLPADKDMLVWMRTAAQSVDDGEYKSPIAARSRVAKPERSAPETPPQFAAALKKNKKAAAVFEKFSPSCKREYIEWIAEAKRDETRDTRIATAVEWISEGKQRNWKYQNC